MEELVLRLRGHDEALREPASTGNLLAAAVMVPLIEAEEGPSLLLTRRSAELLHHTGQVAFPGGLREEKDRDLYATALRESEEEVGVDSRRVDFLASLEPTDTLRRVRIQPYLARWPKGEYRSCSPREVARVFTLSLVQLLEPGAVRQVVVEHAGRRLSVPAIPWEGEIVWGATFRIVQDFLLRLRAVL